MGCLSCKNCEFIRTSAFCGNTKLTQKQLYSKTGYCSHYEPKDTNNPEKSVTMDSDKVIKGLEELSGFLFKEYGKAYAEEANLYYDRFLAVNVAIDLLKEQKKASERNPVLICPHCGKRVK